MKTTILGRLQDRRDLLKAAIGEQESPHLREGAAVVLQSQAGGSNGIEAESPIDGTAAQNISKAVRYRLAVTDVFVEKAQYHLETRAVWYWRLGIVMYVAAILAFASGTGIAVCRMLKPTSPLVAGAVFNATQAWIDLLRQFILAFTAYGFIVLTAVALARGARGCLDQRERLLAKRHSLRQGRLFLHLKGGRVALGDMESAFNWNHEQDNAFTHMPIDAKGPWGTVLEEMIKMTPELVKAGVTAAKDSGGNAGDDKSANRGTKK